MKYHFLPKLITCGKFPLLRSWVVRVNALGKENFFKKIFFLMRLNEIQEILKTHICWYVKAHIKPQQRNKLVSVPFSCEVPFKA